MDLYVYCDANPVNSVDPTGHVALAFTGAAYAIAGVNAWSPVGWIIAGVVTIIVIVAYSEETKKTKTKAKKKRNKWEKKKQVMLLNGQ